MRCWQDKGRSRGASGLEVLQQILHGRPQPLGQEIPAALRKVVKKALENDPTARYQSMREMVEDLRVLIRGSVKGPESIESRRGRLLRSIGAAAALVLIAAAWLALSSRSAARPEYTQLTYFPDSVTSPALSRDGQLLTFIRGSSSFLVRDRFTSSRYSTANRDSSRRTTSRK